LRWRCTKCRRLWVTRIRSLRGANCNTSASGTAALSLPASLDVRTSCPSCQSEAMTAIAMFSLL
jgi:hypothetical protein